MINDICYIYIIFSSKYPNKFARSDYDSCYPGMVLDENIETNRSLRTPTLNDFVFGVVSIPAYNIDI